LIVSSRYDPRWTPRTKNSSRKLDLSNRSDAMYWWGLCSKPLTLERPCYVLIVYPSPSPRVPPPPRSRRRQLAGHLLAQRGEKPCFLSSRVWIANWKDWGEDWSLIQGGGRLGGMATEWRLGDRIGEGEIGCVKSI
jgi:hypothetical protein